MEGSFADASTGVDAFGALMLNSNASVDEPSPAPTIIGTSSPTAGVSSSDLSSSVLLIFFICIIAAVIGFFVCRCLLEDMCDCIGTLNWRRRRACAEMRLAHPPSVIPGAVVVPSSTPATPSSGKHSPKLFGGSDIANAVLEAASYLAQQSQVPGVCEAALLVSTLVNLISEDRSNVAETEARLKRCRLLISMLERAASVLGQIDDIEDTDTTRQVKRTLIQDVQEAVGSMVDLIETFRSKRRITQVVVSSLFKKRMEEAEAAIDQTFKDMMRWLQIDVARKQEEDRRRSSGTRRSPTEAEDEKTENLHFQRQASEAESFASARRLRRQRNLDRIEIPDDSVTISEDLLGKGGFGMVYIADYAGINAAAKVITIDNDRCSRDGRSDGDIEMGTKLSEDDTDRQRKSVLLELQAMMRLRSPHTVNVYGAITSRKDRVVLIMELLTGGDLTSFLRHSKNCIPEWRARRIIGDVCAGMAFLHSKKVIHGDLKSANVLLDGAGRAKIGDFGTSSWAQRSTETGLATYKTSQGNTMHIMSFAWAAPEVLDDKGNSYASDVYSFGIVAWEVLSMKVPWAKAVPSEIYRRVVFKGGRPIIPSDAPVDLACIVGSCWAEDPEERPTSSAIRNKLRTREEQE